jgi:FAD/FMN-containing dehydrogenase/Fe-S oxidoreductase
METMPRQTIPITAGPTAPAALRALREAGPAATDDAAALARDLRRAVRGEVRFDDGSRALYATDGSNYRQVPIGVVLPLDADDVCAAIEVCRRHQAPVLPRGCGTSLAGQCCNVAVILDLSKYMHRVLAIDPGRKIGRVQPGVILDHLRAQAEQHHLTFAPDPSTHSHCTLGGMIGNNSCGVHSVMAGKTSENVHELDIVTYDGLRMRVGPAGPEEIEHIIGSGGRRGDIYRRLRDLRDRYAGLIRARFPKIPRRVSGYNLDKLLPENGFHVAQALVGTEGTCATVLEADVRLVDSPPSRSLLVLGYDDVYTAADDVPRILEAGPVGLEGIDETLVEDMKTTKIHPENVDLLPPGAGWLLVEFGGQTRKESDARAYRLMADLARGPKRPSMKLYDDPQEEHHVWLVRESGLGATAHVPGKKIAWEGWEDSAVPPDKLGDYLREFRELLNRYGYTGALYGHFGQGCVHTRIDFELRTHEGIERYRRFTHDAAHLVVRFGGSLSGEHGDGQSRAELLPIMFGDELVRAFREFKAIWDPDGKMNPGKKVDPYRNDENLRLGEHYHPPAVPTHFQFPNDGHNFAQAMLRCVGIGNCRRTGSGTMCPSYMVTREEQHSTRGRARLLFEMLEGAPLTRGWHDEHVKEALDLCLSCKGCKGDCPVKVDMATYKAEFLSHYYEGRLRPAAAYAFGLLPWWAPMASRMPALANLMTQAPGLRDIAKRLAGIAPQRRIPPLAPAPFTAWFASRRRDRTSPNGSTARRRILLWPDTFNNYFKPGVAQAAVEVLEAAGFDVAIPPVRLCCGRPLYDYGMLGLAKGLLLRVLDVLREDIEAGTPIVGLEPSCVAVFRDELTELFPKHENARRMRMQTFLLGEFLAEHAPGYAPPRLHGRAIFHGHCHQKAVLRADADKDLLKRMGLDVQALDSGCCGMAGGFGFEHDHYDVSIGAGERVLLPAVRRAPVDALIVADGFSCREQIEQTTNRRALHTAQVLHMAMRRTGGGAPGYYPEAKYPEPAAWSAATSVPLLLGAGAAVLAGLALARGVRGRSRPSWKPVPPERETVPATGRPR